MSCPICGKETHAKTRPFCSKRCADIDLGRWFSETYAVPSNDPDDAEAALDALESATDKNETRH